MKSKILVLTIILLTTILLCACQSAPDTATVTQVIDGDTIIIDTGHRVRYIGIDTPEVHPIPEAYGAEAWQANRQLVEGKSIRLERDVSETDKYGRLLRYVYVDDTLANAELVKLGMAEAKAYPPDTRYQDMLEQLEEEARQAGRGMWAK
ncbi:MAG: thermonuclease family protein [Dehalococcoidales bacterium]|nr:thermonuclease family protein [Dehalococcoidales bacterium]